MNDLGAEKIHQQSQVPADDLNLPAMKFNSYSMLRQWLLNDLAEANISVDEARAMGARALCKLRPYATIFGNAEYAIYQQLGAWVAKANMLHAEVDDEND